MERIDTPSTLLSVSSRRRLMEFSAGMREGREFQRLYLKTIEFGKDVRKPHFFGLSMTWRDVRGQLCHAVCSAVGVWAEDSLSSVRRR